MYYSNIFVSNLYSTLSLHKNVTNLLGKEQIQKNDEEYSFLFKNIFRKSTIDSSNIEPAQNLFRIIIQGIFIVLTLNYMGHILKNYNNISSNLENVPICFKTEIDDVLKEKILNVDSLTQVSENEIFSVSSESEGRKNLN